MDTHGNITKLTRKNKGSTKPTIRYRFRMGREGKPIFFKTKAEALEHQKNVSKAIQAKGHDVLEVLDKTTLSSVTASLELLKTSGLTSDHLLQAVRGYTAAISNTALTVTLGEAVEEAFQTTRYKSLRDSSKRNYRSRWNRLVQALGHKAPLGSISVFQIEEFLADQTPKTQHKYYVDLHLLFGVYFVRILRHLSANLLDTVVPPQRVQGERRAPYTYTELVAILEHIEPYSELDRLVHIHFFTGMRSSECMGLTAEMFNLERQVVYLPYGYAKNKMDRNVALTPALQEYLIHSHIPTGGYFSSPYRALVEAFRDACEAAKVEWRGMTGRQTFISHPYEGLFDSDLNLLQKQCGHSIGSDTTLRYYLNMVNPSDVSTYFKLPLRRINEQQWADAISPHDESE